jgi:hypothetical protein
MTGTLMSGIGMGKERSATKMLVSVGDLPRAVFGIVERVADDRRATATSLTNAAV